VTRRKERPACVCVLVCLCMRSVSGQVVKATAGQCAPRRRAGWLSAHLPLSYDAAARNCDRFQDDAVDYLQRAGLFAAEAEAEGRSVDSK